MNKPVYLTEAGYKKLLKQLDTLEKNLAELMATKDNIWHKGGDGWHDNFGFEELERTDIMLSRQIEEIKETIKTANLVTPPNTNESVMIGHKTIVVFDNGEERTFEIVGYLESDSSKNMIAYDTLLGSAILGPKRGDVRRCGEGKEKKHLTIKKIFR